MFISKEMVCVCVMSLGDIFQKSGEIQTLNLIDTCLRRVTEEKSFELSFISVSLKRSWMSRVQRKVS